MAASLSSAGLKLSWLMDRWGVVAVDAARGEPRCAEYNTAAWMSVGSAQRIDQYQFK